jgi:hypothetical protein
MKKKKFHYTISMWSLSIYFAVRRLTPVLRLVLVVFRFLVPVLRLVAGFLAVDLFFLAFPPVAVGIFFSVFR